MVSTKKWMHIDGRIVHVWVFGFREEQIERECQNYLIKDTSDNECKVSNYLIQELSEGN